MKHILVKVPSLSVRDFDYQMREWRHRLAELEIDYIMTQNGFRTKKVQCRFIPGHLYYKQPYKYRGLHFDEVFGFNERDAEYFRRNGSMTKPYSGTFMDYILEMEERIDEN